MKQGGMMRKCAGKTRSAVRYLSLALFFAVICLAFMIVLAVIQIRGSRLPAEDDAIVRTYTVPGIRGEIYDRNGKRIVGNSQSYDLIYEYGAMPDTRREVNLSLLSVLDALIQTGNGDKLSDDLFILEGTYPNMKWVAEAKNKDSDEYAAYVRFLERNELKAASTGVAEIQKYFVNRYKLWSTLYTNEQITSLIRLYYEMERVGFGAYQSYTIAEDVNMNLITSIEESNIEGVNFKIKAERVYDYPGIASHILGQLGYITAETVDYYIEQGYLLDARVGVSGCEAAFESWLHGQDGVMVIRYDENGNQLEKYYETEPVSGNDIYLTIDIDLQLAAEEGLAENVGMISDADAGAITVLDPNSGEVLAMASYPTYDLSRFQSVEYYNSLVSNENLPLYNRALNGVYAPGSTYKIGAALAALEEGVIDETTEQECTGVYLNSAYANDPPTCLGHHSYVNVVEAIKHSCNIFFYHLGDAMGIDAITSYTKRLGLGVATGIELSERTGIVAGPAYRQENGLTQWYGGDTLSAAIGQSDHGYTPLQLSVYLSTVVNGGTRYRAHLLDSVRKFYTGELIEQNESQILEQVAMSEKTYSLLIEGMKQVVENESLQAYFQGVPVTVGGKTGTAEVDGKKPYAVFCGFAPLETPEIVVSCVIEEGSSGSRAAYAVGKVMEKYFEKQALEATPAA